MPIEFPADLTPSREHFELMTERFGMDGLEVLSREYRTASQQEDLVTMGFEPDRIVTPALIVPARDLSGEITGVAACSDIPRQEATSVRTHEHPQESEPRIHVPWGIRDRILLQERPLLIVMGIREADVAASRGHPCLALNSLKDWQAELDLWDRIPLAEREVIFAVDGLSISRQSLRRKVIKFVAFLKDRKSNVRLADLAVGKRPSERGVMHPKSWTNFDGMLGR